MLAARYSWFLCFEGQMGGLMIFRGARTPARGLLRFIRGCRGNIGVMVALLIVPLVGATAMGTEAAGWFLLRRAEQSAADAAAIAAALNNDGEYNGTGYIAEAKAVAARYGFVDGSNNTTVSVAYQHVASVPQCATSNCYVVTIAHTMPLVLTELTGYG